MQRGKNKTAASPKNETDVNAETSKTFMSSAVQLVLISIAGLIVFKTVSDVGVVLFALHPSLMAVGYLILMAQAILAVSGQSIFADVSTHNKRVYAHWVFQTIAIVLITIAQSSIYVNKNNNGYPHYQTIHSYFGLFSYLATLAGIFGGVAAKYSNSLKNFAAPVKFKISHGLLGSILYVIVIVTICLGINQTWANESDAQLRLGTMAILLLSSFYVITKSVKTASSRLASVSKK